MDNHGKRSLEDTINVLKSDTPNHASLPADTSQKARTSSNIREDIVGIWAFVGDENATFVITKDKITYPDQNKSYNYMLKGDSIRIKFEGYDGSYLVGTKGSDTLVLVGDEKQVYYRSKE